MAIKNQVPIISLKVIHSAVQDNEAEENFLAMKCL